MHAVVNKLTLGKPIDEALTSNIEREFGPLIRKHPGFVDAWFVRVSDSEAIVVALYATREAMDEASREIAAPWFAENVRPYLAGPVQRSVGEVVARVSK
jgi:hypothetical protein